MKFSNESIKNVINSVKEKISSAYISGKESLSEKVKGTVFEETSFDLHHITTVFLISVLAFFVTFYSTGFNTTRVDAASMTTPVVEDYNAEALEVAYGDSSKIAMMAKDILGDQVSKVVAPKQISSTGLETVYEIGNYIAKVNVDAKVGESKATLSLETKKTYASKDAKKIVTPTDSETTPVVDGSTYTYNINLKIVDTEAPRINLIMDDTTIRETDDYKAEDYISSITDNVDGVITEYTIENEVPTESDGTLEAGRHYVTIRAKDSSGNEATATLIVRCYEAPKASSSSSYNSSYNAYQNVSYASSAYGGSITAAALAQLGRAQDCTMLVTNSLAAVGIYYHGWPSGYLGLGTIVPYSAAQAGDIVVYSGHVAIYLGNGMAVHGGFNGANTVVYSVNCSAGAYTFVRV